jgi:hypothetical protein
MIMKISDNMIRKLLTKKRLIEFLSSYDSKFGPAPKDLYDCLICKYLKKTLELMYDYTWNVSIDGSFLYIQALDQEEIKLYYCGFLPLWAQEYNMNVVSHDTLDKQNDVSITK